MINLRYHIVSITAVFLALGIGLTLGSTFLDRVTVDTLKNQLDSVQARVDDAEAVNADLSRQLSAATDHDRDLAAQLGERLVEGHLTDMPVLVVATQETDAELVERASSALAGAGADLLGSWWLTDRWDMGDDALEQLRDRLGLTTRDADRVRRIASIRLADILKEAGQAPVATDPATADPGADPTTEVGTDPATDPTGGQAVEPVAVEPELVAQLVSDGFLEYRRAAGGADDRVLLPEGGVRFVFVSGAPPDSGQQAMALSIIEEMASDGPVPVVAAQGLVEVNDDDGDPRPEAIRRTTFVGPVREGELTSAAVSTVDSLDLAAGLAATVLAVEDAVEGRVGHYGVASGAARLLPGPDPAR